MNLNVNKIRSRIILKKFHATEYFSQSEYRISMSFDMKSSWNLIRFNYYIQSILEIKYDVLIYSIESDSST